MSKVYWKTTEPPDAFTGLDGDHEVDEDHALPVGLYWTREEGTSAEAVSEAHPLPISATQLSALLTVASRPPYTSLAAQGWSTMTTSALAGLIVRPDTVAAFEIYNGYPGNGPSLVIDRLFVFNLVSTAVGETYSLWAGVTTPKAAVTSGSFAIKGGAGRAYTGSVIAAVSTTIVDPGWFPWTNAVQKPLQAATVTPQGAQVAEVEGRLVVPPGCSLVLHTVSSIVGQTFTQGASWHEIVL